MLATDGEDFRESQNRKFSGFIGDLAVVALVGGTDDLFACGTEPHGDVAVEGGDTRLGIAEKDQHIGIGDGGFDLIGDGGIPDFAAFLFAGHKTQTAGVDEAEFPSVTDDCCHDTVTGDTCLFVNDGKASAHNGVEKGGLAHIGASYDGNSRERGFFIVRFSHKTLLPESVDKIPQGFGGGAGFFGEVLAVSGVDDAP